MIICYGSHQKLKYWVCQECETQPFFPQANLRVVFAAGNFQRGDGSLWNVPCTQCSSAVIQPFVWVAPVSHTSLSSGRSWQEMQEWWVSHGRWLSNLMPSASTSETGTSCGPCLSRVYQVNLLHSPLSDSSLLSEFNIFWLCYSSMYSICYWFRLWCLWENIRPSLWPHVLFKKIFF